MTTTTEPTTAYAGGWNAYPGWTDTLARETAREWTTAAGEHGHASYYGADQIRRNRAYWLGVARRSRQGH